MPTEHDDPLVPITTDIPASTRQELKVALAVRGVKLKDAVAEALSEWLTTGPALVVDVEEELFQAGYDQATTDVCRALGVRVDEDQADECPHCSDGGHQSPWTRPWAVFVTTELDRDGQPNSLIVGPANCAHVAESDAEWLRELIRKAKRDHRPEGNQE